MDAEREKLLAQVMDQEFVNLVRRWQDAIATPDQGRAGSPLWLVCQALRDWLGPSVVSHTFDANHHRQVAPEQICARITAVAGAAGIGRPHTMLAVLALIERLLRSMGTPEGATATQAWDSALAASELYSKAWLSDFKPTKRLSTYGPDKGT